MVLETTEERATLTQILKEFHKQVHRVNVILRIVFLCL